MRQYQERVVTVGDRKFKIRKVPVAWRKFSDRLPRPRIYVETHPYVVFDFNTGRYLFAAKIGRLSEWLNHFAQLPS